MFGDVLQSLFNVTGGDVLIDSIAIILLAGSGLAYILGRIFRAEQDVQRRIPGAQAGARVSARARVDLALVSIGGRLGDTGAESSKVLRGRLIQAGFHDQKAVLIFFAIRILCASVLALLVGIALLFWTATSEQTLALSVLGTAAVGYLVPSIGLSRLVTRNKNEHRIGFPDVMDLLVVCSQAGLSMEAGLQRIATEVAPAYPSLGRNLEWATREIRSGKPLSRAIESLALRLGIEEALSFSTLLQQSEELGSSLTQSLRAYSDDMRNKRMMRAEEKAYALPAKLVVPLTLFVFPVLIVVIMLPVVISIMAGGS